MIGPSTAGAACTASTGPKTAAGKLRQLANLKQNRGRREELLGLAERLDIETGSEWTPRAYSWFAALSWKGNTRRIRSKRASSSGVSPRLFCNMPTSPTLASAPTSAWGWWRIP